MGIIFCKVGSMSTTLILVQVFIIIFMSIVILLQRSSGSGLGVASGSIAKSYSSNFLVKVTIFLGVLFMLNSLLIAKLFVTESNASKELLDSISRPEVVASKSVGKGVEGVEGMEKVENTPIDIEDID